MSDRDPDECLRQIHSILQDCILHDRRPTLDEAVAMLSWTMAGLDIKRPEVPKHPGWGA